MELRAKKVIVTGGASGLGRSMVEHLLAKGAAVSVVDVDASGLEVLEQRFPGIACIPCDVGDPVEVATAIDGYFQKFGAPDVLINNAGILHSEPLVRIGPQGVEKHAIDTWNRVLAADLSSVFYMAVCVAEKMLLTRTRGVLVNISSVSASGNAGQSAYSAAKAAVNALTATWAKELGPMGIRVVAVAPGFMSTESTRKVMSDSALQDVIRRIPLRRLGKPEEVAAAVLGVVENDYCHGKVFELDGGLVI